jgi:hypothetical protein
MVTLLLLYAVIPVGSIRERAGLISATILGVVWMFWVGYAILGLQIRSQGHTQFVRFAATFFFWFFSLAPLLGVTQAFRGQVTWPFAILVPAATALGVLRAWARVRPRPQAVPPGPALPMS